MTFDWLRMRIAEEKDRRERERAISGGLPAAFDALRAHLAACVEAYNDSFGAGEAALRAEASSIEVSRGEARARVSLDYALPGFRVESAAEPLAILVGLLPGDKLSYRDGEKYLTLEEMTRRILDRTLFPKLKD